MSEPAGEDWVWADPGRLRYALAGALLLTAAGAYSLVNATNGFVVAVGVFGVAFFGLCTLVIGWRVLRPRPVLILKPEGIEDRSSLGGAGFVLWDDLAPPRIVSVVGQRMVALPARDPSVVERVLRRQPPGKRWFVGRNQRWGLIVVADAVVPCEELLARIALYMDRSGR